MQWKSEEFNQLQFHEKKFSGDLRKSSGQISDKL